MKKVLITGGAVFVSRHAARYYVQQYEVYILNRNSKPQCNGVTLIEADRHNLNDIIINFRFDVVWDIIAYSRADVNDLLDGIGSFTDCVIA